MTNDTEKRRATEQHWVASEAGDVELEHRLYAEDAILDYPQSGERFVGRSTIAEQRSGNPADRHFTVRRVLGTGSLWVSECVITYDGAPSISVSIMEFSGDLIAHETQYFADPFEAPAARARLAQRFDPGSWSSSWSYAVGMCGNPAPTSMIAGATTSKTGTTWTTVSSDAGSAARSAAISTASVDAREPSVATTSLCSLFPSDE